MKTTKVEYVLDDFPLRIIPPPGLVVFRLFGQTWLAQFEK